MNLKNSFNFIRNFRQNIGLEIRKLYFSSSFYNKKISKIEKKKLLYKPNPSLFDCLVKYNKIKKNIDEFLVSTIWEDQNINQKKYKKLHNFFWLYSIDLKSSNKITQSIIENWIDKNIMYKSQVWETDVLSKRIISWISNSKLTYEDSSEEYKEKFNFLISKQLNHLINDIERSKLPDDKIIGCTAIILAGISYKEDYYINYGSKLLKYIISFSLDQEGFPKSRNFRQLYFYLKYFVLIRELFKEVYLEVPDYLDEAIFYLGQSYNLFWQSTKISNLFNGSNEINNSDFDTYLLDKGYNFKNSKNEIGGYVHLKNNKSSLIIDVGKPPIKKFSKDYQSGTFSFEFTYLGNKIICNSGYFQKQKHQLNNISRSSVAHSTLVLDNSSISKFKSNNLGIKYVENNLKIFDKKIIEDKNNWFVSASHDGYLKNYGVIHKRSLEFLNKNCLLKGRDEIIKKKKFKYSQFEIRFHLLPEAKITKTIDEKTILIEIGNTGWKFRCNDYQIEVEAGLYFGKKNLYIENKNILILGNTLKNNQAICWELVKI